MRWWLLAIAGCGFKHGVMASNPTDGSMTDDTEMIDGPPDAFDPLCFGASPFGVCVPAMPIAPLTIDGINVVTNPSTTAGKCANDTGDIVTMGGGVQVCAISATTLTLGAVYAAGGLPLVFVASQTITVNGDISANSANTGNSGPGANSPLCGDMTSTSGTASATGAGGGAGGSFGGRGGNGGNGVTAAPGGVAIAAVTSPQNVLHGGCSGGPGGVGASTRAPGGDGGGAVYLVARQSITLTATGIITASAGGGTGGVAGYGGAGGGGSGGMIVLAAPMLMIDPAARVFANGGGGGGGAGATAGTDGNSGNLASTLASAALGGGVNDVGATAGGNGGYLAVSAVSPGQSTNGGAGGGGGGVGVIRVMYGQTVPAANVSPPPE